MEINIALYYDKINRNEALMIKYYLLAIEQDNDIAMCKLANYYLSCYNDTIYSKCFENSDEKIKIKNYYDLVVKYYLMAIEKIMLMQ